MQPIFFSGGSQETVTSPIALLRDSSKWRLVSINYEGWMVEIVGFGPNYWFGLIPTEIQIDTWPFIPG